MTDTDAHGPLTDVLDAYREEHRDLVETWRALDTKAQGVAAIAGIFLAGLFAFLRDVTAHPPSAVVRLGLALATVVLVVSVILAILALRVRHTQAAPLGAPLEELARDLMKLTKEERVERMPEFIQDQVTLWREANEGLQKQCSAKATLAAWAQYSLLGAIVVVAVTTLAIVAGVA